MSQAVTGDAVLERLRALLADEGEAIAPALSPAGGDVVVGPLVSACAAGRDDTEELALVLESILEGYLLHYRRGRLLDTDDEDLRLLAGDHLYAVGLSRLARLGDLDAVRALADLITLCARAHADGGTARQPAALWLLSALVVCGGRWPGYERLLGAAHEGRADMDELLAEGRRRAAEMGVGLQAQAALIAFASAVADRPHA